MNELFGLFGHPPPALAAFPDDARQVFPLVLGAAELGACDGTLTGMVMLAAPGTLERHHGLAGMLRALAVGARFTVLGPKDMGGVRLEVRRRASKLTPKSGPS